MNKYELILKRLQDTREKFVQKGYALKKEEGKAIQKIQDDCGKLGHIFKANDEEKRSLDCVVCGDFELGPGWTPP